MAAMAESRLVAEFGRIFDVSRESKWMTLSCQDGPFDSVATHQWIAQRWCCSGVIYRYRLTGYHWIARDPEPGIYGLHKLNCRGWVYLSQSPSVGGG
jgi:hypothetical protein